MIAPIAPPGLRIAGALFLVVYLLPGVYFFRNRRRFFGPDPRVAWLVLTTLLVVLWTGLWIN